MTEEEKLGGIQTYGEHGVAGNIHCGRLEVMEVDKKRKSRGRGSGTRKLPPENTPKLPPRGSVSIKGTKKVPAMYTK